jgi:hypothetical protein
MSTLQTAFFTFSWPLVLVACALLGVPVLTITFLLARATAIALSGDRVRAEHARLIVATLLATLCTLLRCAEGRKR